MITKRNLEKLGGGLPVAAFAGTTIGMTPLLSDRVEASKQFRRNTPSFHLMGERVPTK
jgi:hypothetical protein